MHCYQAACQTIYGINHNSHTFKNKFMHSAKQWLCNLMFNYSVCVLEGLDWPARSIHFCYLVLGHIPNVSFLSPDICYTATLPMIWWNCAWWQHLPIWYCNLAQWRLCLRHILPFVTMWVSPCILVQSPSELWRAQSTSLQTVEAHRAINISLVPRPSPAPFLHTASDQKPHMESIITPIPSKTNSCTELHSDYVT